jgi:plastocyanin
MPAIRRLLIAVPAVTAVIVPLTSAEASTHATARTAAARTVTISDYKFSASTVTIHVGTAVRWKNNGPSQHSAKARNGAFNTGLLSPGHSASHTFRHAGKYSYFCSIHPFMHGTVIVLAH